METVQLYLDRLPRVRKPDFDPDTTIVIFDRKLLTAVPGFKTWIAAFPHRFPVRSGESLKSFSSFEQTLTRIHKAVGDKAGPRWTVLAIGGGSVGDFAGFFASVYKRGLKLVHMPTTWLAAIDSSHGGKTGLNFGGAKNQIGTFYPSDMTVMVKSILLSLPPKQVLDAFGELIKIAVIDGGPWVKRLRLGGAQGRHQGCLKMALMLWKALPDAVEAKMKIVRRDPKEQTGVRHVLNLGHTFGHVIESLTGRSHGESIWLGFLFAVEFSLAEGYLKLREAEALNEWLKLQSAPLQKIQKTQIKIKTAEARKRLLQDKKRVTGSARQNVQDEVRFVFVRGLGKTAVAPVSVEKILKVAKQNGWLK